MLTERDLRNIENLINEQNSRLEERMYKLEEQMDKIDKNMDKLEKRLDRLDERLNDFRKYTVQWLTLIESNILLKFSLLFNAYMNTRNEIDKIYSRSYKNMGKF